jgi:hypothetical protein
MTRSRLRFKALGVCALAISLTSVWASAARAEETGGKWTYLGPGGGLKTFEGLLAEPEIGVEVEKDSEEKPIPLILHTQVFGSTKVLYECKAVEAAAGSKLRANGVVLGKLIFTQCKASLNGVASAPCTPKEEKITTNLIKAQMLLHKLPNESKDKILIAEGQTVEGKAASFAFIESTMLCMLGSKIPIEGKFAIDLINPTTHGLKLLFREFSQLNSLWIISNTAEHRVYLLGLGLAFLTGEHKGLEWAGLWN